MICGGYNEDDKYRTACEGAEAGAGKKIYHLVFLILKPYYLSLLS
jgi:hypothetical protein